MSEADLALSDPRYDLLPEAASGIRGQLLGVEGSRLKVEDVQSFDFGQVAGRTPQDMVRSFVTVRRNSAPNAGGASRGSSRGASDGLGLDLGFTTNEWVRESVQGVMTTVLNLNVNERGQASFSVLGFGDFSVVFSGDRSEVAFLSGDDVLATARRSAHIAGGPAGNAGGQWNSPLASAQGEASELKLRQAIEFAVEVASHPLSFILYAVIGGYAMVWIILSGSGKRHSRSAAHNASARRTSSAHLHAVDAAAVPAPKKKIRKRMRVRLRVRKYR